MDEHNGKAARFLHYVSACIGVHEFVFALNLAAACAYGLLLAMATIQSVGLSDAPAAYYLRRAGVRLGDWLHLTSRTPVSADMVRRVGLSSSLILTQTVALVVTIFGAALLVAILLQLMRGRRPHRFILSRVAGVTALLAIPAAYLIATKLTWRFHDGFEIREGISFWQSLPFSVFAGEVLALTFIAGVCRTRPLSRITTAVLVALHCMFWIFVVVPWSRLQAGTGVFFWFCAPALMAVATALWLTSLGPRLVVRRSSGYASSLVALGLLGVTAALWLPPVARHHIDATQPVVVELARGPCFGSCPSYTLRIHENGLVEYAGHANVRLRGTDVARVPPAEVEKLLQRFESIRYFSLEDRAFAWCYDTATVAVSITAGGQAKRVVSDVFCSPKTGPQADFIQAAAAIDRLIGSDKWTRCNRGPCWR